jgi:SAM-dependent methyltransferase
VALSAALELIDTALMQTEATPPSVSRPSVGEAPWLTPRLSRVLPALACPSCDAELIIIESGATCRNCQRVYPHRAGKLYFTEPWRTDDSSGRLKESLKRALGNVLYRYLLPLFGPTYPFSFRRAICREGDPSKVLVVDVGSGNHRLDDDIIALDGVDYPCVDIVADVTALPFKSDSIDIIASRSLLEHVWPIESALSEMKRCTAPGGANLHLIPFLFPFHASPADFQRLTHAGAAALFTDWNVTAQYHVFGPFTLFLVLTSEILALLLSFGMPRLRAVLGIVICAVLSPIKFLDFPFLYIRSFVTVAPSILTIARKPPRTLEVRRDDGGFPR